MHSFCTNRVNLLRVRAHAPHLHAQGQNVGYWICLHWVVNVIYKKGRKETNQASNVKTVVCASHILRNNLKKDAVEFREMSVSSSFLNCVVYNWFIAPLIWVQVNLCVHVWKDRAEIQPQIWKFVIILFDLMMTVGPSTLLLFRSTSARRRAPGQHPAPDSSAWATRFTWLNCRTDFRNIRTMSVHDHSLNARSKDSRPPLP